MIGVTLVAGALLAASLINSADCVATYHIAFLGRETNSTGVADGSSSIGTLKYQNSAAIPDVISEVVCSWGLNDTSNSANIKELKPTGNCSGLVPNASGIASSGFKVVSNTDDMILHVYQAGSSGENADGFLAIPDNYLGNEYYVITYCSLGGFCQFAVAGTVDVTSVYIVFPLEVSLVNVTCNGAPLPANALTGQPVPFTLNEYEVLHIESEADLSGTYISSDNKVSVIVGSRDVPHTDGLSSFMIEQIPPVSKWGTEFVVVPNKLNKAGDVIKILTKSDNTLIHILGFSPFTLVNKGEAKEFRVDWEMPSSITTSKPVLIVQVMSVNLYNDTTAVTGRPAIVLVPHVQQWYGTTPFSDCLQMDLNQSVVTVTADQFAPLYHGLDSVSWMEIEGTGYAVYTFLANGAEIQQNSGGINITSYGYCDGKAAILLDATWEWENEECEPSMPVPGDGVDNDCDGQTDEDECTIDDLAIVFDTTQDYNTGEITFKSVIIKGRNHVKFTVKSCFNAIVSLVTNANPELSFTANILPGQVHLQTCFKDCNNVIVQTNATDCTQAVDYEIEWNTTTHVFRANDLEEDIDFPGSTMFEYDLLVASAFVGTADFNIKLPEKDCNKIVSGPEADNFGKKFVLSVEVADTDHSLFITNYKNAPEVRIDILGDEDEKQTSQLEQNKTLTITKADLTLEYSNWLIIEAQGEISVYVIRQIDQVSFGHPVIPTDVLGTKYQKFNGSDSDCTVHSIGPGATSHAVGEIAEGLVKQHLIHYNRPVAVFCERTQIPPRETLGKLHYVPALNLEAMDAHAEIHLVATEDSTVVIIRGNYDQLDTVKLTGSVYNRPIENNTVYNISATKPIQVHLSFTTDSPHWNSVVLIPPVEQYKSEHVFPGFNSSDYTYDQSKAVDDSGSAVETKVSNINAQPQFVRYGSPTFSLTVIRKITGASMFIIPSDVMYKDINQVCDITRGQPGDGMDNDCDGLIDEEQCSDDINPGSIDVDIDGSLNEDCASGTSATRTPISLSLATSSGLCPTDDGTTEGPSEDASQTNGENETNNAGITISNGVTTNTGTASGPDEETSSGSEATYDHVDSSGGIIQTSSSVTAAPGSTSVTKDDMQPSPVETCVTDYICPCGWVQIPKNYTTEELQEKIAEIQEKLKLSKDSLSATIRAKTSAPDNRVEATTVGYVGVVFLVTMMGAMVLLDITTIARDIRVLVGNVREVFQP